MTAREQLIQEIAQAPDFLIEEVLDFLLFSKLIPEQNISVSEPSSPPEQKSKPIWEIFEEFTSILTRGSNFSATRRRFSTSRSLSLRYTKARIMRRIFADTFLPLRLCDFA